MRERLSTRQPVLVFGLDVLEFGDDDAEVIDLGNDDPDPFGLGDNERFSARRMLLAERPVPPRLVRERPAFGTVRNRPGRRGSTSTAG
jgi:hypothetical protein